MYVIAGATGRVGSATAGALIAAGAEVRVLVRQDTDAKRWEEAGAEAVVTALDDEEGCARALGGAAGVLHPAPVRPRRRRPRRPRRPAHRRHRRGRGPAAVPHVVMLSSGGADLTTGTGPITGLHRLEEAPRATGTRLTAPRSGHFQEKVADVVDLARTTGLYPVFASSAEVPVPMVATRDLGATAARARSSRRRRARPSTSSGPPGPNRRSPRCSGAVSAVSSPSTSFPPPAWAGALTEAGFRPHVAESLAELYRADEAGLLAPRGDRSVTVTTTIEETIAGLLGAGGTDPGAGERS